MSILGAVARMLGYDYHGGALQSKPGYLDVVPKDIRCMIVEFVAVDPYSLATAIAMDSLWATKFMENQPRKELRALLIYTPEPALIQWLGAVRAAYGNGNDALRARFSLHVRRVVRPRTPRAAAIKSLAEAVVCDRYVAALCRHLSDDEAQLCRLLVDGPGQSPTARALARAMEAELWPLASKMVDIGVYAGNGQCLFWLTSHTEHAPQWLVDKIVRRLGGDACCALSVYCIFNDKPRTLETVLTLRAREVRADQVLLCMDCSGGTSRGARWAQFARHVKLTADQCSLLATCALDGKISKGDELLAQLERSPSFDVDYVVAKLLSRGCLDLAVRYFPRIKPVGGALVLAIVDEDRVERGAALMESVEFNVAAVDTRLQLLDIIFREYNSAISGQTYQRLHRKGFRMRNSWLLVVKALIAGDKEFAAAVLSTMEVTDYAATTLACEMVATHRISPNATIKPLLDTGHVNAKGLLHAVIMYDIPPRHPMRSEIYTWTLYTGERSIVAPR